MKNACLLLLLLLAACGIAPTPSDPYVDQAANSAAIRRTEQAIDEHNAQSTLDAQKFESDTNRMVKRLGVTQTAWALAHVEATATIGAYQLQAAQSTATMQIAVGQATQAALSIEATTKQKTAERDQAISEFVGWGVPLALLLMGLILAAGLGLALIIWILRRDRKVIVNRSGVIVIDMRGTQITPWPSLPIIQPQIPASAGKPESKVWQVAPSVMASSGDEFDPSTQLVLDLVDAAISVAGKEARQIPRWEQLPGWNKEKTEQAKDLLEDSELVAIVPNRGTYLTRHDCLADLALDIELGKARITPLP